MNDAQAHYRNLLGEVYAWSLGGTQAACARAADEIDALLPHLPAGAQVVDLGAGFGAHALALARRGASVLAIDTDPTLLAALREMCAGLPVRAVRSDLLDFARHLDARADAIVCLGDTLTHLAQPADVRALAERAVRALAPGGRFIATLRDHTDARSGIDRFVDVRSDADRILTCFLEYDGPGHVEVHDLLYERDGAQWRRRASRYRKLRLAPQGLCATLLASGFERARIESGAHGMVRVIASLQ